MAYRGSKDLPRRMASYKVLRDKAFNIAKSPKDDGYQRGIVLIVDKVFNKTSSGGAVEKKLLSNQHHSDLAKD